MIKRLSIVLIVVLFFICLMKFSEILRPRQGNNHLISSQLSPTASVEKNIVPSQFSAWIPWWEEKRTLHSLKKARMKLTSLSPIWYKLHQDGTIKRIETSHAKEILQLSIQSEITILPTVANDFDGKRVSLLLADKEKQRNQIVNLVQIAQSYGYQGWDLDWEEVEEADREKFSTFIKLLAENLHQNGLVLSVTVHAQTGKPADWEGAKGQDWSQLANSADFIRIMAYDFHNSETEPGPITPISDLEAVIRYALSVIPLHKIVLALPAYGYDWGVGPGEPLQYENILQRLKAYQGTWSRDLQSSALVGKYAHENIEHTIWFEDKESILHKIEIGRSWGINQFCFWSLGGEDENLWDALN